MKYIRTKNAIYEIIDETENSFELCGPFEKKIGCSCTMIKRLLGSNKKPTYRLADTIEELCDEFVDTSELKTTDTGGWLYDEFDSKNKCLIYYVEDERRAISLNEFDDLYKIYAPYLNNPALKQVRRYNNNNPIRPNNMNYLNNLEKYYNNMYNKNKKEGPERKVIPKRKLSPIRRKIINIY